MTEKQHDLIEFLDLAVLAVLNREPPPTQRQLWSAHESLINDWLLDQGVTERGLLFATPVSGVRRVALSIARLRQIHAVAAAGSYTVTGIGRQLLTRLGPDWTRWPLEVPLNGSDLDFSRANYTL